MSDSDSSTSLLIDKEQSISVQNIIDRIGNSNKLLYHLLILGICNSADAIEITAFGYILNLIKLEDGTLVSENEFWGGALASSVFTGMLVGGLFCGFLSDKFGRKSLLFHCMALNFFGAICSSLTLYLPFSMQLTWLLIARLVAGVGVGGTIPSVFSLCSEIAPTSLKPQAVNFVASFWMFGLIYTSSAAYLLLSEDVQHLKSDTATQHWPLFAFVAGLPAGFAALCVYCIIDKSPRFLEEHGNNCDASAILKKYLSSRVGENSCNFLSLFPSDKSIPTSTSILSNDQCLRLIEIYKEKEPDNSKRVDISVKEALKKLFSLQYRSIVIRLLIVWFTLSFASYGLLSWIATLFTQVGFSENPYVPSLYFAIASFPGNVFAIYMSGRLSAEILLAISLFLSCISLLFALDDKSELKILLGSSGFQCFSSTAWNALGTVSTKSFSTDIRASAYGVLSGAGRIGGIVAGFVNGLLFSNSEQGGIWVLTFNAAIIGVGCFAILTKVTFGSR